MHFGTFRDPSGSLFDVDDRILRVIRAEDAKRFEAIVRHPSVVGLVEKGNLVASNRIDTSSVPDGLRRHDGVWYEHDRVRFVSVPQEWSAAMLAQAARLTLDINLDLIRNGFILKDATPANVLFESTRAVLVDVPSIEPLRPGSRVWLARQQFETTFLLPLLALLDADVPLQWSLADPATGVSHEQVAALLGARRWLNWTRLMHVALPTLLGQMSAAPPLSPQAVVSSTGASGNLEKTRYILTQSLQGLRTAIDRLAARVEARRSHWSGYAGARSHYSEADLTAKRAFVTRVLQAAEPGCVLDVGANTGEFSEMASTTSNVVAIDLDEVSVSEIHARARVKGQRIQPLVVDLARPTSSSGWCNAERKSFLDRAMGRFDLVLMLAVGHHLRVSAGIPLEQVLELGLKIGDGSLLYEFVPTDDPMFRAIARGREPIYTDNTVENCAAILAARGAIELRETLSNGRTLFWVRRKS